MFYYRLFRGDCNDFNDFGFHFVCAHLNRNWWSEWKVISSSFFVELNWRRCNICIDFVSILGKEGRRETVRFTVVNVGQK
jgi:hypothetical protein